MREIRPISEMGNRIQEAGRIRLGAKKVSPKKPGSALSTFRFTSPHFDLIAELAAVYKGEVVEWNEPKARHPNQWEVVSEASTIPVLVPPGGLSQWYEEWSGKGCTRRCDGETCSIPPPRSSPDEARPEVPCICKEEGARACDPKTRITVVLPEITFRGTWRCDTGSWFAAEELPAVEAMLDQLQQTHVIVEAQLTIESRQQMTEEGKRKFVVPVLSIPYSFTEIAGGGAQFLPAAGAPSLAPPDPFETPALAAVPDLPDDEVIDAEIVETPPSLEAVHARLRMVANQNDLDRDQLERAVALGVAEREFIDNHFTDAQAAKALQFLSQLQSQELVIVRFNEQGRAMLKRKTGDNT